MATRPERNFDEHQQYLSTRAIQGLPDNRTAYTVFAKRSSFFHSPEDGFRFYEVLTPIARLAPAANIVEHINAEAVARGFGPLAAAVEMTIQIFVSAYDAPQGVLPLPEPAERARGEHVVVIIGGRDHHYAFAHSWGRLNPNWGINGLGILTPEYINACALEAWLSRNVPGPLLAGNDVLPFSRADLDGQGAVSGGWPGDVAPNYDIFFQSDSHIYTSERLVSALAAEIVVRCCQFRIDEGEPVLTGWSHIRLAATGDPLIEEFFIWPAAREVGLGRALFSQILAQAMKAGHGKIRWRACRADVEVQRLAPEPPRLAAWVSDLPWQRASTFVPGAEGQPGDVEARFDVVTTLQSVMEPLYSVRRGRTSTLS